LVFLRMLLKSDDAFAAHSYTLPRPKANNSSGLFRFLLCSRPCFHQHSVDADEENPHAAGIDEENGNLGNGNCGDLVWPLRTELQVSASSFFAFFVSNWSEDCRVSFVTFWRVRVEHLLDWDVQE